MASFIDGSFNIPEGYVEEEIKGQLYYEDLDEDSELWLIRLPSDIQLSVLDKKRVHLGDNANVKNIETQDGKLLECCAENCDIPNLCVVLPEKNGKKLHAVQKVFKGAILISEGLSYDTEVKRETYDGEEKEAVCDTLESIGKQNRKKKRHSHSTDNYDINYETEDADNINLTVKKIKHCKKRSEINRKRTLESMEIKNEPEYSENLDDFPSCASQN